MVPYILYGCTIPLFNIIGTFIEWDKEQIEGVIKVQEKGMNVLIRRIYHEQNGR